MAIKCRSTVVTLIKAAFITCFLCGQAGASSATCAENDYSESCWAKLNPTSSKLIVFVHGIDGSSKESWSGTIGEEQITWPELVAGDALFEDADILVSNYFSSRWSDSPSIATLAANFADHLRENGALDKTESGADRYQSVLFVAHSMGGLIVRQALIDHNDLAERTKALFTFATPTGGSQLANWLSPFSSSQSLEDMKRVFQLKYELNSNQEVVAASSPFLRDLRNRWRDNGLLETIKSYCAYETLPSEAFGLAKIVVTERDAEFLCNRTSPLWGSHSEIVFPADGWLGHSLLVSWYLEVFPDLVPRLEPEAKGGTVLAQCNTEYYTGEEYALMQQYLDEVSDGQKFKVRVSRFLPDDWRDDYLSYLWNSSGAEPSLLIIHYSCFQEGPEDETGWYERKRDNVEFLNSLIPTNVKIIFFSRAFVGGSSGEVVKSDGSAGYRFYPDVDASGIPDSRMKPIRDSFFNPGCRRLFSVFSGVKTQEQREEFEETFKDAVRDARQASC